MNEETDTQRGTGAQPQPKPERRPTEPNTGPKASMPGQGWVGTRPDLRRWFARSPLPYSPRRWCWARSSCCGRSRTFVGWFVIALFLAAVLNPAVNWLQRRHRLMKRPLAIGLTYLGVLVALLFVVGIFLPVLVDQINGLTKFVSTAANAPRGPQEYIKGLAKDNGLGGFLQRFDDQLESLRDELGQLVRNIFSSSGQIAVSARRVRRRAGHGLDTNLLPAPW